MKFPSSPTLPAFLSLVLLTGTASSQQGENRPGSLLEIVAGHDRRISRIEADIRSLYLTRLQQSHTPSQSGPAHPLSADGTSYRVKPGESLGQIAKKHGISTADLAKFNHIQDPNQIVVGQSINIPGKGVSRPESNPNTGTGTTQNFTSISIPNSSPDRSSTPNPSSRARTEYTVKKGDTLHSIASSHGISTPALRDANGLFTDQIHVGQRLRIPHAEFASSPTKIPSSPSTHIVKKSETSASIARQYGISVSELTRANGIDDPSHIVVGQPLTIPSSKNPSPSSPSAGHTPAAPPRKDHYATYRVRKGDTISAIAREFEVSPSAILEANGLSASDTIRTGDDIKIPLDQFWATLTPPR